MNGKKLAFIVISAVIVLAIAFSVFAFFAPGDFRRAKWGMSQNQVRARENLELKNETSSSLVYELTELEGVKFHSLVHYNFDSYAEGLTHVTIGINASGFEDKLIARLIKAFEKNYGEADEYTADDTVRNYYWNLPRTGINIRQLSSYVLITYKNINLSAEGTPVAP